MSLNLDKAQAEEEENDQDEDADEEIDAPPEKLLVRAMDTMSREVLLRCSTGHT